jgi:hypothetical protein
LLVHALRSLTIAEVEATSTPKNQTQDRSDHRAAATNTCAGSADTSGLGLSSAPIQRTALCSGRLQALRPQSRRGAWQGFPLKKIDMN